MRKYGSALIASLELVEQDPRIQIRNPYIQLAFPVCNPETLNSISETLIEFPFPKSDKTNNFSYHRSYVNVYTDVTLVSYQKASSSSTRGLVLKNIAFEASFSCVTPRTIHPSFPPQTPLDVIRRIAFSIPGLCKRLQRALSEGAAVVNAHSGHGIHHIVFTNVCCLVLVFGGYLEGIWVGLV